MQHVLKNSGNVFYNEGKTAMTTVMSEKYKKIAHQLYDVPVARCGDNTMNMFDHIGPLETRKASTILATGQLASVGPQVMGPVEFIKVVQEINPDAAFIFIIGMDVQTPEESANFASFLLDDADASEWGALRASYGIEEPVNLIGFELGNELYERAEPDSSMSDEEAEEYTATAINEYVNISIEHIEAIKKVAPDVNIMPCVNPSLGSPTSSDLWNEGVAQGLGAYVDTVAFHYYFNTASSIASGMKQMDKIQNMFINATGNPVKFAITEHAVWALDEVGCRSLNACLVNANFINQVSKRDSRRSNQNC